MPDFSDIDNRCLDSWYISISGRFKYGYLLNISCSKIFDSCKIKCMVTDLTQQEYVNNYDKNRYLEKISKAAVYLYGTLLRSTGSLPIPMVHYYHLLARYLSLCYSTTI